MINENNDECKLTTIKLKEIQTGLTLNKDTSDNEMDKDDNKSNDY